jgi:hypothetical protein
MGAEAASAGASAGEAAATAKTPNAGTPFSLTLALGIVGLIASSGGMLYWMRQRAHS